MSRRVETSLADQTGSQGNFESAKEILYPFDKYMIKIILSPTNEFVGIEEVFVNKDFVSYSQKNCNKSIIDIEKFYPD